MFEVYSKIIVISSIFIFVGTISVSGKKENNKCFLNCTDHNGCPKGQYCSSHGCVPYGQPGDACPCQRQYECEAGKCRVPICSRNADCSRQQCCVALCQVERSEQGRCQSLGQAGDFCSSWNVSTLIHSGYCPCKDLLECRDGMCQQRVCQKNSECPPNHCCVRFRCIELGLRYRDVCEPKQNYSPESMMENACPCASGFKCSPKTETCERPRCHNSSDCLPGICCKRRRCRECRPNTGLRSVIGPVSAAVYHEGGPTNNGFSWTPVTDRTELQLVALMTATFVLDEGMPGYSSLTLKQILRVHKEQDFGLEFTTVHFIAGYPFGSFPIRYCRGCVHWSGNPGHICDQVWTTCNFI